MTGSNNVNLAHSELLELKNLGMATVNILQAIGINTYEDLAKMGAVGAYHKVKCRGINVSKVMLYALQGALMDAHWNDLPPDLKRSLVADFEKLESGTAADTLA